MTNPAVPGSGSLPSPSPCLPDEVACPYCARCLLDPDQGTLANGLYEVRCDCGAWLEILRHVAISLSIRQCSPTVPPRVFLGD